MGKKCQIDISPGKLSMDAAPNYKAKKQHAENFNKTQPYIELECHAH